MNADTLRRAAAAACLAMAALLVLLQFALTPDRAAPFLLFVLFTGVFLFGAAMLLVAPTFGALGTTAWGVIAAVGSWRTHDAVDWENAIIVLGSLVTAALAAAYLVASRRRAGTV